MRVLISDDALAIACGADRVAAEFVRQAPEAEIVRVSSWGMHWLEPLVEIEVDDERRGYGPVGPSDVSDILRHSRESGNPASSSTSAPETGEKEERELDSRFRGNDGMWGEEVASHRFLAGQSRLTFARAGKTRPLSLEDYEAAGGWAGLRAALVLPPAEITAAVTASGLRGRGGAGFPAGIKWETVRNAPAPRKYIVCNADEGDSGTFADRMLMEGDPFCLIEGMAIAGVATGASYGYIYIRSEYPHAIRKMEAAIEIARDASWLGARIGGSDHAFEMEIRVGAGAYVCGEETSLLNSLEGKRGEVRFKPPLPAIEGLFGMPTVVNNVLTLAAVPRIMANGPQAYADFGMGRSRGTMPIQIAGNVKYGGLYETGFGLTLGEIVNQVGGGTASGRPVRAVQVGGPLGAYFPPALFDTPFDYEAFTAQDGLIGHGGVVVFDDSVDMLEQARFAMEFCAAESCGKCTPCRIGAVRGREIFERIRAGSRAGPDAADEIALVRDLCETLKWGSLCALGGFTPFPVLSALDHFPEDFEREAAE